MKIVSIYKRIDWLIIGLLLGLFVLTIDSSIVTFVDPVMVIKQPPPFYHLATIFALLGFPLLIVGERISAVTWFTINEWWRLKRTLRWVLMIYLLFALVYRLYVAILLHRL